MMLATATVLLSSTVANAGSCADINVLGMPGSRQGINNNDSNGYGVEVGAVIGRIRHAADLGKVHFTEAIDFRSINYPAKLVPYFPSKDAGYNALFQYMQKAVATCGPHTFFVLVGYSQSAHIIGDIVQNAMQGKGPVVVDQILAVALMADPRSNPLSNGATLTRIGGGFGFGLAGPRPAWGANAPVRSICKFGDVVCDNYATLTPRPEIIAAQVLVEETRNIHTRAYITSNWPGSRSTVAEFLSDWAVQQINIAVGERGA